MLYVADKRKGSQIDHIMLLSMSETNEPDNLQVLCQDCHFEKSKAEQEEGYVKESLTESVKNNI